MDRRGFLGMFAALGFVRTGQVVELPPMRTISGFVPVTEELADPSFEQFMRMVEHRIMDSFQRRADEYMLHGSGAEEER